MTNPDPNAAAAVPSMADVARLAGVSSQTVSRALRGHSYIKPETKQRVLDAVEQLGYRMNTAAQALKSGRNRTIGTVTMATGSYAGAITTASIEHRAAMLGYSVIGAQTEAVDAAAIADAVVRLVQRGVEGLILAVPLRGTDERINAVTTQLPTVTIGGSTSAFATSLAVDQQLIARLATQHLLRLGHETVHIIAGPDDWVDAADRVTGWRTTLEASGRPIPDPLHGDWSPESGYQAGLVLGRDENVSAILVASDDMAFGVIRALHELGCRVPDDISVVGVDDVMLAAYCSPALTTVAQPFETLAAAAVDRIVSALDELPDNASSVDIAPHLVVRASTAAPSSRR